MNDRNAPDRPPLGRQAPWRGEGRLRHEGRGWGRFRVQKAEFSGGYGERPNRRLASGVELCQTHPPLPNPSEAVTCKPLEVQVGDKGIERAIKHLKRKMAAEGILRELKRRRQYMKPSVKRRKKMSEAARRRRKRLKTEERP